MISPDGTSKEEDKRALETRVAIAHNGKFFFENTLEISKIGLKILTAASFSIGEKVELFFFLPGGHFINTKAKVSYKANHNGTSYFGFRFVWLSPGAAQAIDGYINSPGKP